MSLGVMLGMIPAHLVVSTTLGLLCVPKIKQTSNRFMQRPQKDPEEFKVPKSCGNFHQHKRKTLLDFTATQSASSKLLMAPGKHLQIQQPHLPLAGGEKHFQEGAVSIKP